LGLNFEKLRVLNNLFEDQLQIFFFNVILYELPISFILFEKIAYVYIYIHKILCRKNKSIKKIYLILKVSLSIIAIP